MKNIYRNDIRKIKRFKRGDSIPNRTAQMWVILISYVMQNGHGGTITYGDLAELMDLPRNAGVTLGPELGLIGWYCEFNALPLLNTIVVNKISGMPGDEVYLRKDRSIKQEQNAVYKENWYEIRVPTTGTFRKVRKRMINE